MDAQDRDNEIFFMELLPVAIQELAAEACPEERPQRDHHVAYIRWRLAAFERMWAPGTPRSEIETGWV